MEWEKWGERGFSLEDEQKSELIKGIKELIKYVKKQEAENKQIKKEIQRQKKENERLKKLLGEQDKNNNVGKIYLAITQNSIQAKRKYHRKRGQKTGHKGMTRQKPQHIDKVIKTRLKKCPQCDTKLGKPQGTEEHIQEDIIPARPVVVKYVRNKYYCRGCYGFVQQYGPGEIPCATLGPNVLSSAVVMNKRHGLPHAKIAEIFKQLCGFEVSQGGVQQAVRRVGKYLKDEEKALVELIRKSKKAYIDETGWPIKGIGHWLWTFSNGDIVLYRVDKSRGAKVPKRVLTKKFNGTVISDFLGAYNKLPGSKQKCLLHLVREIKKFEYIPMTAGAANACVKLLGIITAMIKEYERLHKTEATAEKMNKTADKHRDILMLWATRKYKTKLLARIAKRIRKHLNQLVTFFTKEGVQWHNNEAERRIRPSVVTRKISNGSDSYKGAQNTGRLLSFIESLRSKKLPIAAVLSLAYIHHRKKENGLVIAPLLRGP